MTATTDNRRRARGREIDGASPTIESLQSRISEMTSDIAGKVVMSQGAFDEQQARIRELEQGLRPFAEAWLLWSAADGGVSDSAEVDDQGALTFGHLREASRLLKEGGKG